MATTANSTTLPQIHRRGFLKAFAALGIAGTAAAQADTPIIEPDKFTGDGWYTHKERAGTLSAHHIERRWSDMDQEWHYLTKPWPADQSYVDHVFDRDEVNAFIHGPAEWVQDGADLVWGGTWRVRRED